MSYLTRGALASEKAGNDKVICNFDITAAVGSTVAKFKASSRRYSMRHAISKARSPADQGASVQDQGIRIPSPTPSTGATDETSGLSSPPPSRSQSPDVSVRFGESRPQSPSFSPSPPLEPTVPGPSTLHQDRPSPTPSTGATDETSGLSSPPPSRSQSPDVRDNVWFGELRPQSPSFSPLPPLEPTIPGPSALHQDRIRAPYDGPSKQKQRNARNRRAHKKLPAQQARKREASRAKLMRRIEREAIAVAAPLETVDFPFSERGFSGSKTSSKSIPEIMTSKEGQEQLKALRIITFKSHRIDSFSLKGPTEFRTCEGNKFAVRSFLSQRIDPAFMERLLLALDDFITACRRTSPSGAHTRGRFLQISMGWNHGTGEGANYPYRTAFLKRPGIMRHFKALMATPEMRFVIELVTDFMNLYFPGIASLSKKLADFWEKKTKGETIPDFGLFYLMALNLDVGEPVLSIQHRDNKNFALGVCLLFIFGFFDDGELCWLVCWEAGIIIQLPGGVLFAFPSALCTHLNVNRTDFDPDHNKFELVTTRNWSRPTLSNSRPLQNLREGRGSLVFYNPASFFHWFTMGSQFLPKGKNFDYAANVNTMFPVA